MRGRRAALLVCGAGILAFGARCGAGPERADAGLELRLEILDAAGAESASFAAGQTVGLVLELRNSGRAPLRIEFPTARTHDFAVSDAEGREIWRWSRGRLFAQALTEIELAPGEARRFAAAWDQRDASGATVEPGRYRVVGSLAGSPAPPPVGPLELEIESPRP